MVAMYARRSKSLLVISLALAIHGYTVAMSMLPLSADASNAEDFITLKVLNSNLLLVNTEYQVQLNYIASVDPDIIALQEYTPAWDNKLSAALSKYPHRALQPAHGSFGIALYSKFPIIDGRVEKFSSNTTLAVDSIIDLGDKHVRVLAVHPPPPTPGLMYTMRNEQLQLIAEKAASYDEPMIVLGDFNSTPWTTHFTNMESTGKLRNASAGHGFHPTWPNVWYLMPMLIPIDHILVNSQIGVVHFDSKQLLGSDHKAIWSELRVY